MGLVTDFCLKWYFLNNYYVFSQNCNMEDVPCPSVYVERVGFEMDKKYAETKLQVLISPAVLIAKDNVEVNIIFSI